MRQALIVIGLLSFFLALSGCSILIQKPKITEAQQSLEDKLLVVQSGSWLQQIALLEGFQTGENNNDQINLRIEELRGQLALKEALLLACGNRYRDSDIKLAQECAQLARSINRSDASDAALQYIEQRIAAKAREKENNKNAKLKRKRDSLRVLAKKQTQQPDHSATIKTLNKLLEITPDDEDVKQRLSELKSVQKKHIDELIAVGDRLYRDEKIEKALAVWKAVKSISENNIELIGKIDRAEKVLGSVNKIKGISSPLTPDDVPQ